MRAAIYDIATGEVRRIVIVPAGMVMEQLAEGEEIYLNCPAEATHIVDGAPVVLAPPEPPPPTLEEARSIKEAEIRTEGGRRLTALAAPYSATERETWDTQLREAEAFFVDPAAPTPMMDGIAVSRGITRAEIAGLIVGNATVFRAEAGKILGQQQALLGQLWAASSHGEIQMLAWPRKEV